MAAGDAIGTVRAIDRARAARLVQAQLTEDPLMFATTLQETLEDDYGFGQLGSAINVFRLLADDLAGALRDVHGDERAAALLRDLIAQHATADDD
jgi:hypothetical protein